MNNTKQASDKYKEAKDNYIRAFWADLKAVFDEYPKLEDFQMGVNNHEWNDGSSTTFSISWDSEIDCNYDGEEHNDVYPDDPNTEDPMNKSLALICEIFSQSEPIHEDMFGDEYERVCISREMVDIKIAELAGNKQPELAESE